MSLSRRQLALAGLALLPAGCVAPQAPACATAPEDATAWLLDRGWHTEIALPLTALAGPIAGLRAVFPGARAMLFGFGQRDFLLAPRRSLGVWLAAPLPGPAVIEVTALRVPVPDAITVPRIALPLAAAGQAALADFCWESLAPDAAGQPVAVGRSVLGSVFYAARAGYSLAHTCNTWVAEALARAGLPIQSTGVVLAGQVLGPVARLAGSCGG